MTEDLFDLLIIAWLALAIVLVPVQLRITAPYGRHVRPRWGPTVDNRVGWIVMEAVSPVVFAAALFWRAPPQSAIVWVIFALWIGHYAYRTLIFPLRLRTPGKRMPVVIVASGMLFNTVNGWANGYFLGVLSPGYPADWFGDPRFVIGIALFVSGALLHIWADHRLIALRAPGETGYRIPRGGLFERVSCPNHLGEIIEWTGFAILCWNLPAAAFAVWTAANLGPRAWRHHQWYKDRFPDYPRRRKALIPYIL